MGNSATKEQRPPTPQSHPNNLRQTSSAGGTESPGQPSSDFPVQVLYGSRHPRGSRPDLSFLGIGSSSDRDASAVEARRETKVEREARKVEKERIAREKERERSMKEESVDGGYLVTQGVYTGTEDFNKAVVRQLMASNLEFLHWPRAHLYAD